MLYISRFVLLLSLILKFLAFQGCALNHDVTVSQLRECSEKMHILFPPSTKPLNIRKMAFQDELIDLKIEIDKKDLGVLISNSPYKNIELSKEALILGNSPELDWWRPGDAQDFLTEKVRLSNRESLVILIDLDKPNKAIVYLSYYTF
jgi:hypothetical protein